MRRILTVGMACLVAFTLTVPPASAADLGMPVKAPPVEAPPPPELDYWPILLALLIAGGITACILECSPGEKGGGGPVTTGANGGGVGG